MIFIYSRSFSKAFGKCSNDVQKIVRKKLTMFQENRFNPQLSNHQLHGKYSHLRSMNITGDIRLLFEEFDNGERILLTKIGTHSELYK